MRQVDAAIAQAPRLAVGLVQPNFAYTTEGDYSREEAVRELSALREQSRRLTRQGAELVVWSEGSYPVALPRDFNEDFPEDSEARIRLGFDGPVIVGANTIESELGDAWNTALLLDRKGLLIGRYDKVKLLAFGETVPGMDLFPWLQNLLPAGSSRFRAGAGPGVLTLDVPGSGTWRLGMLICYEDLLPEFIGHTGKLHPDLLVNLTSDQWFGAGAEPYEHLALSVFSTIELRVALARAVNSGISALIDPNGRIVARTYADDPYRDPRPSDGKLVSAPKMAGGHTLFVAWGDWFAYACLIATAALAVRNPPGALQ
jgi:apolipoprotein N-acyltransferase